MPTPEPPKSRLREGVTVLLLVACLAAVLLATMWPTPLDQGYSASIDKFLSVLHRNGVPQWFGYNKLEFSANIVMFLPLGFLVTMLLPGKVWWLALVLCPALSVSIEFAQGALLSARFATISDVVANSFGAIVGAFFAVLLRAAVHNRDQKLIARILWQNQLPG